jgi:hypothetical protein
MKTSITTRLASFAAALAITFTTVHAVASYALPQAADTVLASACRCR